MASFGPRFALEVFQSNSYNNFLVDRFINHSHNTDWTWNWSNYGYFGLNYVKNIPSVPSQAVKSVWLSSKSIPKQGFSCIFGAIWIWSNRHNGLGPFCLWQCFLDKESVDLKVLVWVNKFWVASLCCSKKRCYSTWIFQNLPLCPLLQLHDLLLKRLCLFLVSLKFDSFNIMSTKSIYNDWACFVGLQ